MALSNFPEYLMHAKHYLEGNYAESLIFLEKILKDHQRELTEDDVSFLKTRIGYLYFKLNKKDLAIRCFSEAEEYLQNSFHVKFQYAKFLIYDIKDLEAGRNKCKNAIKLLVESPFDEDADDISSSKYIEKFQELINASNFNK